jgi:hypothetical protein
VRGLIYQISPRRIREDADVNTTTHAHIAQHDNAEDNNNDNVAATDGDDRPELHVHVGQAGDQPPVKVDDDKKEGQGGVQHSKFDADISNPSNHASNFIVGDDNNDMTGLYHWHPSFPPKSTQKTSKRYSVSP